MIYLDATSISTFLKCREAYRQRNVENRVEIYPAIHLSFGSAVHTAVEHWHRGMSFKDCLAFAAAEMELLDEGSLNRFDQEDWRKLGYSLIDVVGAYCNTVTPEPDAEIEKEWMYQYNEEVTLVGKIDRYSRKGVLYDVKTASEVAPPKRTMKSWRQVYRETSLRSFQFGLYDWYLRIGMRQVASAVKVECIVKPYRDKPCRIEIFDLPEILVYRNRFDQQLAAVIDEITWCHNHPHQPWLQASNDVCVGKFSACDYLPLCNLGETPKTLALYREREEHLVCLKNLRANSD